MTLKELPRLVKVRYWFVGPQYDYLYRDGKRIVDFIGRYKNLEKDFRYVAKTLDLPHAKLPHINQSTTYKGPKYLKHDLRLLKHNPRLIAHYSKDKIQSSRYQKYYDDELIEFVGTIYQKDIDAFNYSFN